ncbi:ADP-ribosylglycohydrolase [Caldanaerobius fijiensis DSM 17918]|uniref:ADP-ribosylglycohydrolase n=1 Tax=Caldanaerobius fijiensis DSM 17918 TaxID=1121256 RepID=A0A1M5B2L0_9THEO|nr:ADP-ribosylglycohydrolase [Caldanaerobius fijiensis DSM 17918]
MVKGNTFDAIIAGVNMGRDTDCIAAIAAGISGALTGHSSIPEEYIKQVDYATKKNIYTNSQRTIEETAEQLYDAFKARIKKMKEYIEVMDI